MIEYQAVIDAFRAEIDRPESEIDLARAALTVARLEYPDLDIEEWLDRLEGHAGEVRARLSAEASMEERVATLSRYLFAEQGFRGNGEDYYDPSNSCLNAVLERRLGIPITLSLVYIELGRRIGVPAEGVAFPGHFLVRVHCERGIVVLDAFRQGLTLSESEVRGRLKDALGDLAAGRVQLGSVLTAAGEKAILARMLRNMKRVYSSAGELTKAVAAATMILDAEPNAADDLRDRGLLYRELEAYRAAFEDLSRYLTLAPDADDAETVRNRMVDLSGIVARLN